MLTIKRIPPEFVSQRWETIEPLLLKVLPHCGDEYTLDQIKVYLTAGSWLLLAACDEQDNIHGIASIQFNNMPNYRVAFIVTISGKFITSNDMLEQFIQVLKLHGATKIEGAVRPAMLRFSKKYGFNTKSVLIEKHI